MTIQALAKAYLDPARFPVTTQKGLNLMHQKIIDSHNFVELMEWEEAGNPLSENQKAIKAEFLEKMRLVQEDANKPTTPPDVA